MATKWGIVTCGKIARDFTIALQTLSPREHQIVAVAARDRKKAEKFANDFRIAKHYGCYEQLAKDPDVDVAYVATINPSHVAVCKMMMDNGKHVLCEKPMGMNKRQCQELIDHAKMRNVFLLEAMWSRFNPAFVELRRVIESGDIGAVKHVNCTFGIPMQTVERLGAKKLGGGITLDIGIYCVNLSSIVFWREKPTRILASGLVNKDGVDWSASCILEYPGGRSSNFTYSGLVSLPNEATITGTKGILRLKTPFWSTDELICDDTGETLFRVPKIDVKTHFNNSFILRYEAIEVRNCLMQGRQMSNRMTWDDTLGIHSVLDEIRRQIGVVYDEDLSPAEREARNTRNDRVGDCFWYGICPRCGRRRLECSASASSLVGAVPAAAAAAATATTRNVTADDDDGDVQLDGTSGGRQQQQQHVIHDDLMLLAAASRHHQHHQNHGQQTAANGCHYRNCWEPQRDMDDEHCCCCFVEQPQPGAACCRHDETDC